jgi:hypothetical protein
MFALSLSSAVLIGTMKMRVLERAKESSTVGTLFAGVNFVRHNSAILGTISLDLFAVLLGGATALLPIYASDILHTGPWGLGVLRGVPSLGALAMTAVLARRARKARASKCFRLSSCLVWPPWYLAFSDPAPGRTPRWRTGALTDSRALNEDTANAEPSLHEADWHCRTLYSQ